MTSPYREHPQANSDEILPITRLYLDRDSHEVLYKCPHCEAIRGFDDDLYHNEYHDFVNSIFTDNLCGGEAIIEENHRFINNVDNL